MHLGTHVYIEDIVLFCLVYILSCFVLCVCVSVSVCVFIFFIFLFMKECVLDDSRMAWACHRSGIRISMLPLSQVLIEL